MPPMYSLIDLGMPHPSPRGVKKMDEIETRNGAEPCSNMRDIFTDKNKDSVAPSTPTCTYFSLCVGPARASSILSMSNPAAFVNDFRLVVGPLVIGTVFNAFVYGVCLLQFSHYWEHSGKMTDSIIIK